MTWEKAQEWEENWHGLCINTYGEEEKQLLYANRMGLVTFHNGKSPYNFNLKDKRILDIGGGPSSLLLKCVDFREGIVVDPLKFPDWVISRYYDVGIKLRTIAAEEVKWLVIYDEIWIYNTLQHVKNPAVIIKNAQKMSRIIRIFEWLETEVNIGHPHSFTESQLNEWLGGYGKVEVLKGQAGCYGKCYYGIFRGNGY